MDSSSLIFLGTLLGPLVRQASICDMRWNHRSCIAQLQEARHPSADKMTDYHWRFPHFQPQGIRKECSHDAKIIQLVQRRRTHSGPVFVSSLHDDCQLFEKLTLPSVATHPGRVGGP
ncbi:uncharacterized protein BJX67DRAFT_267245 [Aspergillus lucknowensis]|uniref:Secreted protein n=1 Tax=Aspergillus lucknowensis TaxID=176173 RepID=A0ABR4LI51_9EURO